MEGSNNRPPLPPPHPPEPEAVASNPALPASKYRSQSTFSPDRPELRFFSPQGDSATRGIESPPCPRRRTVDDGIGCSIGRRDPRFCRSPTRHRTHRSPCDRQRTQRDRGISYPNALSSFFSTCAYMVELLMAPRSRGTISGIR
jgi:hypothetical protein